LPDAFDPDDFIMSLDRNGCRNKLGLPLNKKIVLYSGHLYEWKGAHILAEASSAFPEISFIFIGGMAGDVERFKKAFGDRQNISILGMKPHHEVPYYLRAADILVIPNSGKSDISKLYTSPLKLFEYMASGTPIIVSDLPSMREILNESNALFFQPDDVANLSKAIGKMAVYDRLGRSLAERAMTDVASFTWINRARSISDSIQHLP